jgi:hypothetical protein
LALIPPRVRGEQNLVDAATVHDGAKQRDRETIVSPLLASSLSTSSFQACHLGLQCLRTNGALRITMVPRRIAPLAEDRRSAIEQPMPESQRALPKAVLVGRDAAQDHCDLAIATKP